MNKELGQKIIAFQGNHGAYMDLACRAAYPDYETLPCETFHLTFEAVQEKRADLAMIAIDNTIAGRVADVHHLIPDSGLFIIGEYFHPIRHNLMSVRGAQLSDIKHIHSHIHALPQCRNLIKELNAKPHVESDTAGSAKLVAEKGSKEHAAIASSLAAKIYGLDILKEDVQDAEHNTTRFVTFSRNPQIPAFEKNQKYITSFIFQVQSIPAALYKTLGGFATNGVNMLKLESYIDNKFNAAQFFADVEGHVEEPKLKRALEELEYFSKSYTYLGTYPFDVFRTKK